MGGTKKGKSSKITAHSVKPKGKHGGSEAETKKETSKSSRNLNGLDEIEDLFACKKQQQKDTDEKIKKQKAENKQKRKAGAATKEVSPTTTDSIKKGQWVDDGLGGKYNSEGYTGRVEDGMKIFKTHLLQSAESGKTPDCPFDCKCCFI